MVCCTNPVMVVVQTIFDREFHRVEIDLSDGGPWCCMTDIEQRAFGKYSTTQTDDRVIRMSTALSRRWYRSLGHRGRAESFNRPGQTL